jgi:hypothetical protein
MDAEELNIRRVAAVNPGIYYRSWVYIETVADEPTGLYPVNNVAERIKLFGYADEEYGLMDDKLPITRAEYDDGAAIIDRKPCDVQGRVALRVRFVSSYNFLIAPFGSPINSGDFDYELQSYLNRLLIGEDVFEEMAHKIARLPKRIVD